MGKKGKGSRTRKHNKSSRANKANLSSTAADVDASSKRSSQLPSRSLFSQIIIIGITARAFSQFRSSNSPSPNVAKALSPTTIIVEGSSVHNNDIDVPMMPFAGPLSKYPNPRNITEELRQMFHPVVKFPIVWLDTVAGDGNSSTDPNDERKKKKVSKYHILDFTQTSGDTHLIPPDRQDEFRKARRDEEGLLGAFLPLPSSKKNYTIGKYDENRVNLYSSELFQDDTNSIDGYDGARTLHVGIDLGGPVGTKVYSFWHGIIHSLGYNDELGDYGYVIVIKYDIPTDGIHVGHNDDSAKEGENSLWALYGHLDKKSIKNKFVGQTIKRGQFLGRMGDVHENGGWSTPHVHFQLSITEPDTHDMPGAVKIEDRLKALVQYPDPRLVLGPLY